jgi:hypothetical protein
MSKRVVTKEAPSTVSQALTSTVVRPYLIRFALVLEASAGLASVFGVGDCTAAMRPTGMFESACTHMCYRAVKLTTKETKIYMYAPVRPPVPR